MTGRRGKRTPIKAKLRVVKKVCNNLGELLRPPSEITPNTSASSAIVPIDALPTISIASSSSASSILCPSPTVSISFVEEEPTVGTLSTDGSSISGTTALFEDESPETIIKTLVSSFMLKNTPLIGRYVACVRGEGGNMYSTIFNEMKTAFTNYFTQQISKASMKSEAALLDKLLESDPENVSVTDTILDQARGGIRSKRNVVAHNTSRLFMELINQILFSNIMS